MPRPYERQSFCFTPLEILKPDPGNTPQFKLRENLAPFVPYVDKPSKTAASRIPATSSTILLDERWINLSTIQNWLETCDRLHKLHCQSPDQISETEWQGPVWLIDVSRSCLVRVQSRKSYFALSYVWGQKPSTAATTKNIQNLQEENALESESVNLPRTVKDAIGLVRLLHGQYLWVDRLCIIQDGLEKGAQLSQMATIYSSSYATIIATQGSDSTYGLRGIQHVTKPRNISSIRNIGDDSQSDDSQTNEDKVYMGLEDGTGNENILEHQARILMQTEWYKRAWTFQEQLFSRRKIVFQGQTVNWECHCMAWHEGQSLDMQLSQPCSKNPSNEPYGFNKTPWPDFYRYARLVALYNQRQLTYPEDVIDAFTGVISNLSPTFHGGFISGLPQMFFDCALLWQPYRELVRRKSVKRPKEETCLPSWSWVGWQGELDSHSWRSGYEYMRKNPDEYVEFDRTIWRKCTWRTTSTVKWYYIDKSGDRHVISISGHCYRDNSFEMGFVLPAGWTRIGQFFRHDCDPAQTFWYPIPLCYPQPANVTSVQARLISCRTRRAFVFLGSSFHISEVSKCAHVDIRDDMGDQIGALRLQFYPWNYRQSELRWKKHELIELSAGSVQNPIVENVPFDEWHCSDCSWTSDKYEFYNVMWIERENGIAYRQCLGRVTKGAWENIAMEEIEIILG
jgi:heterokaryon incompatibility protein (HET)